MAHRNARLALFSDETFDEILVGFTRWLTRLNYGKDTIKSRTHQLKYFMRWMSEREITQLSDIRKTDLEAYNEHLHGRPIGGKTIEDYLCTLKKLNEYLESYGHAPVVKVRLRVEKSLKIERVIVTVEEASRLYEACDDTILGMRDRVMLAIYYGCGLRYSEGSDLVLSDLNLSESLLRVRKGKNYRERYVPISTGVRRILAAWVSDGHVLFTGGNTDLVVPSIRGIKWQNSGINLRLKKLCKQADIDKRISLHCLRHSIATHLLQGGMDLESISQFLGHRGMEATKIYTRIIDG